jgi:hypothetical protein
MVNPFKKSKRSYHLSEVGRAALSASAQKIRPWLHSTGPRTAEGKQMSSRNNFKHGYYCRSSPVPEAAAYRAFAKAMRREVHKETRPQLGPPVWEE